VAEENDRHWHRTRETFQQDRTRVINRLKGLLATLGVAVPVAGDFLNAVRKARLWDGTPVPPGAYARLQHEWALLQDVERHLEEIDATREARRLEPATARCATKLQTLRGVGPLGAEVLATEIFGWRHIRNGRELGALVGLVPGRYQSGETDRELGITRAGNTHVRRISVQLAWSWLRNQRASALVEWYQRRFGGGSKRLRRIGIVALARKLLVALWRYVDQGVVPDGAELKPTAN
jgi:transposase